MKSREFIREVTDADFAKIRKDAEASLKTSLDKQSDARIAKAKQGQKSFMSQVGDKIIGGVKGAAKGFAGGTAAIKETASAGATGAGSVAAVVKELSGNGSKELRKRQQTYTNQVSKGGPVKTKKDK